jgi:polysaccharide chain length determinant protein (PEP-CTERM system associated)
MLGHRTLNVEDYVTILKRRWWIILIPALILPVIAVGATYLMTPEYVSSTLVLIDQQKIPGDFVKPVVAEALDSRLAYYTEQILSRSNIEPIITKYNLYGDQHLSMDARVELARKALHIDPIQSEIARTNGLPGFKIAFTANDPHTAQQVCAEITSQFTGVNLKARTAAASNTTDFLQEQINAAKQTLDDQDAKMAEFQQKNFGMLPGDQGNNENIMGGLNSRLDATTQTIEQLEQNRSVVEALLAQQVPSSSGAGGGAAKAPAVEEEQEADLTAHYTPDYPDVKAIHRKIEDLKAQMAKEASAPPPVVSSAPSAPSRSDSTNVITLRAQLRGIDVQLQAKQKEQDDLKRQIQGYMSRIQSTPEVEAQYKELTRDSETALAFYNKLKSEMDQSQMTNDLEHRQEGETFTVLDAASLPTEPTFPKTTNFAAGGVAAGLMLGALIVALLEYRDTALRTEREVWDFTHLPTLAVIAWSGATGDVKQPKPGLLKRLFGRKQSTDVIADAQG